MFNKIDLEIEDILKWWENCSPQEREDFLFCIGYLEEEDLWFVDLGYEPKELE